MKARCLDRVRNEECGRMKNEDEECGWDSLSILDGGGSKRKIQYQ